MEQRLGTPMSPVRNRDHGTALQAGLLEQTAAVTRVEPCAAAVTRGQWGRKVWLGRAHQHSVDGRSAVRFLGDAFLVGAFVSVLSNGAIRSARLLLSVDSDLWTE